MEMYFQLMESYALDAGMALQCRWGPSRGSGPTVPLNRLNLYVGRENVTTKTTSSGPQYQWVKLDEARSSKITAHNFEESFRIISDWWFGTMEYLWLSIQLGMSSSQPEGLFYHQPDVVFHSLSSMPAYHGLPVGSRPIYASRDGFCHCLLPLGEDVPRWRPGWSNEPQEVWWMVLSYIYNCIYIW